MLRRILKTTGCAAAFCASALLLIAYSSKQSQQSEENGRIDSLIENEWQYEKQTHPELATAAGDNRYNDRLNDYSSQAYLTQLAHDRETLAKFETVGENLSDSGLLNRTLMIRMLQIRIEREQLKQWEMPVDQMNGPHLEGAELPEDMPFRTAQDYENYLARLHQLPRVLNQLSELARSGMRDHLVPPRYILEKVAEECADIGAQPVEKSSFTAPLNRFPAEIADTDRARLGSAIRGTIGKEVLPAYATFAEFVKTEYAPRGRTGFGVWSLPDGDARYRQAIHEQTTTDMAPGDLHKMGLEQVATIEAAMRGIARKLGYADLPSFNAHIFQDRALHGVSGEQIFSLYQRYTNQMYPKLPQYFGRLPKNKLAVVPMEAYRAPHEVPADYSIGAADGSRPGRINVNEYGPSKRLLLNVEAIAYHEGIPGHHLQFSIAQELPDVAAFRRFASDNPYSPNYNSYSEGWALYAETLSHEMGFYQDPYSEYGRLQNLMWRSIRLVVDTGVHSEHWSRQQMIDFFHQHTAMDDQNIETEVDRYIAWPGQALGYKLGEMTILRLRERARQQLGAKFDIRAFHDAVLNKGPLPLDVLEEQVNGWLSHAQ